MKDFIMTVHITNSAGFRELNSLSNIFAIIGFYFEACTVIMVAHFKWRQWCSTVICLYWLLVCESPCICH